MTNKLTDEEIVARFAGEPAPFLALANAFMDRDGMLSFGAVDAIARALGKSPGAFGVTLGYYKRFPQEGVDEPLPRRPLEPVAVPAPSPGEVEECAFASIREPGNETMDGYRRSGGYELLERCLEEGDPGRLIDTIAASGLRGRGGGGYLTGEKWRAAAEAAGEEKVVICNGDEGDPGSFKDRTLLELDPHRVVEGLALAGLATGASLGFIYLRGDYARAEEVLRGAVEEARRASLLGDNIREKDRSFDIFVRRGAGTYVCGEETALMNTLEGGIPMPRTRPPYPSERGFEGRPTVVNNAETLAAVPRILARGADWYRSLGRGDHLGTRLVSLTGDVARPGCYEIPAGLPLPELVDDWAGGPKGDRPITAAALAGVSGGFLRSGAFGVELDDDSLRAQGARLGNGAIELFDETRDLAAVAAERIRFLAAETCFKCEACVVGVEQLAALFDEGPGNQAFDAWRARVEDVCDSMRLDVVCGFAGAAAHTAMSALTRLRGDLESHLNR